MANPTSKVNTQLVDFGQTKKWLPLVGGGTKAKTYQTGQMIGRFTGGGNAGFVSDFDNAAAMKFEGIVFGNHVQVDSGDANGAKMVRVDKPQFIVLKKITGTVSRATDIGKPAFAVDADTFALTLAEGGTNSNLIGYIEDIVVTDENFAGLTSTYALIRCAHSNEAETAA